MIDPVKLTQDLIRCRSVTPGEGGALDLIEALLTPAGFLVHRLKFSSPGMPEIDNLYARLGVDTPCFAFAGHTDVVPPGDEKSWSHPPFAAEIAGGLLYGRGAADMKGGVAASIAAALNYAARNPGLKGSIAFLLTGDEEGPAVNGSVKLLQWVKARGETFDHCLLGEPTNPDALGEMIKNGRRGSLYGTLVVHGVQGHVAYPERAVNPIEHMARIISAVKSAPLDSGTAHFSPSNLEFTTVDTDNPVTNVIPGNVSAAFNIRFNDLWTTAGLAEEIGSRISVAAEGIRYDLAFAPSNSPPFATAPGAFTELVSGAVQAVTGKTPVLSTAGGTSDARFIKDYCPVIEFGLAGGTMHQTDEHVRVDDIIALAKIYELVLERYFPGDSR